MTTEDVADKPSPRARFSRAIGEALRGSQQDFTEGHLGRAIAILAIPMVLEMAGESLFAICDAFFVARLGPSALATVALTEGLLALIYALAVGLSMATTAMVARRFGEKDYAGAGQVAVQAIILGAAIALIVGLVGVVTVPSLLRVMGATPDILEVGAQYSQVMFGGVITILLLFLNNAAFRGAGDAAVSMRSLWLANLINLVLDPCLIFGLGPFPELGLLGAAVATNIGRGTGVLYQLAVLSTQGGRLKVQRAQIKVDPGVMVRLLRVASGGVAQMLIGTASWVGLVRILAAFGSNALAGYLLAVRVVIFALLPAFGFSNAAATLVGQNLGAKRPERAERAVWMTGFYNMLFLGGVTVVFLVLARPIVSIFTHDPEVLATGVACLRTVSYGYIFYAWGMVTVQAFNGAGDTLTPTIVNFFCFWLFQIPMAFVLARPLGFGPAGVFWAIALSYSLAAVVGLLLFRRGRWKRQEV